MKGKQLYLLFIFSVITLILYYPTRHAGFVLDFVAWQNKFNHQSILGAFTDFGYHAQQQFFLLLFYSLSKLFGLNGIYWYVLFSILHSLNAWLLFRLFMRILERFKIEDGFLIAFTGALLFLISPYQAEVVVWKVCLHYLMVTALLLIILHTAIDFFETGKKKYWLINFICFFLALYSLELSIILPVALTAFAIGWNISGEKNKRWIRETVLLVLPQLLLLPVYFLLNKILFGALIGHYGENVHLQFDFYSTVSGYLKYFVKYLFFLRYFSYPVKTPVFDFFNQHSVVIIASLILLTMLILAFLYRSKISTRIRLAGFCCVMFLIMLIPVINLYMSTIMLSESDRYGYMASMFFFMMMTVLIFALPKIFRTVIIAAYAVISVLLLRTTTSVWQQGNDVYLGLINDFRWFDKKEIYVLNIPDDYHGIWMFRIINKPSVLPQCLSVIRNQSCNGEITDIAQYNMMTPNDGISVTADSLKQLHVQFNQWGNWWWRNGVGAGDYETKDYAVHFVDNGYVLRFKMFDPNSTIIYQVADKWKEFKMP